MSDNQKSYSVPHSILVCYDEHRIHGMRMSLIMHRFPPVDGEEIGYDQQATLREIDEEILSTPIKVMGFVGDATFRGESIYEEK